MEAISVEEARLDLGLELIKDELLTDASPKEDLEGTSAANLERFRV